MARVLAPIAILAASFLFAQAKPDVAALVGRSLGPGVAPYARVRPVIADFNGDGVPDLAVVIDFNKELQRWLRRGTVIHDLGSPSLAALRPDNDQHFCFGLLMLENMQPEQKTIFYGCFTGWRLVRGAPPANRAALDLEMEDGSTLRLYNDGAHFRTRVVRRN